MNFDALVQAISTIHRHTQGTAARAVNVALTCRNWLIGAYIHEYELRGQDRAEYGELLMQRLAETLCKQTIPTCERPRLYAYLAFYRAYPQIGETIPLILGEPAIRTPETSDIFRALTGKSEPAENERYCPRRISRQCYWRSCRLSCLNLATVSASKRLKNGCSSAARPSSSTSCFIIACSNAMCWSNSRWMSSDTNTSAN